MLAGYIGLDGAVFADLNGTIKLETEEPKVKDALLSSIATQVMCLERTVIAQRDEISRLNDDLIRQYAKVGLAERRANLADKFHFRDVWFSPCFAGAGWFFALVSTAAYFSYH